MLDVAFRSVLARGLAALAVLCAVSVAHAADYPDHPLEIVVPWSPGGSSDTLMRIVAEEVEPYLGEPVKVVNVPGVSGTLALRQVSEKKADGYTVVQLHEGLPVAYKTGLTDLQWSDFKPVALLTCSPQFLVVSADSPWRSVADFVAYAKLHPDEVRMGVTFGGVPHLHAAMIEDAMGVDFAYVGYEGAAQRIKALREGRIDVALGDIPSALKYVRSGELRFLAAGSGARLAETPDVPTLKELGYDLELEVSRGIAMPAGAPDAARDTLEAALRRLSRDDRYRARLEAAGAVPDFRGHEAYRDYLRSLDTTIDRLIGRLNR